MTITSNALSVPLLDDWVDPCIDVGQVSGWHSFLELVDDHPSNRGCWVCDRSGFAGRALKAVRFSDLMDLPVDVDACEDYWRIEGTI
jgi:hypothetical protein